ncbi:hypothetical protein I7I48_08595 [Histoplasma ohiense]|nr:hypothetical protein I7I48_08595 [Histoplasma ohiense (nom. inval.)]
MEGQHILCSPQPNRPNPRAHLSPNNNPHNPHPIRPPQRPRRNPNRRSRHPPFPQRPPFDREILHKHLPIKPAHRPAKYQAPR